MSTLYHQLPILESFPEVPKRIQKRWLTLYKPLLRGHALLTALFPGPAFKASVLNWHVNASNSDRTDLCGNEIMWQPCVYQFCRTCFHESTQLQQVDRWMPQLASSLDATCSHLGNLFVESWPVFHACNPDVKTNAWEPGLVMWNFGSRGRGLCGARRLGSFEDEPSPIGENP